MICPNCRAKIPEWEVKLTFPAFQTCACCHSMGAEVPGKCLRCTAQTIRNTQPPKQRIFPVIDWEDEANPFDIDDWQPMDYWEDEI